MTEEQTHGPKKVVIPDATFRHAGKCMEIAASAFKPEDLLGAFEAWLVEGESQPPRKRTLKAVLTEHPKDFNFFYVLSLRRVSRLLDDATFAEIRGEENPLDL